MTMEKNYGYLISKDEIKQMVNMAYPRDRAIIYVMALSGMSQREVRDLTLKKIY
jgi:integrase